MNYQQTIDFLNSQLPMFSRNGASAITPDLKNTLELCRYLNFPQNQFKSIHIAGTNGKGSTSHMIAAMLQTAGYKTGLYTSPHLWDFRERIRINGKKIEEEAVVKFVKEIHPLISKLQPSYFEITVAMAFRYFAEQQIDFAVIETGMGGRLDSTNIIQPVLSVITNISLDHTDKLGNTLAAIAGEKAGIIKYQTPVIIGNTQEETTDVFVRKAAAENAPIVFAGQQWQYTGHAIVNNKLQATYFNPQRTQNLKVETDQIGLYQLKNLPSVFEAAVQLNKLGYAVSEEALLQSLKNVKQLTGLRGRWETLQRNPLVIADVGHNIDGITSILSQPELKTAKKIHIVIGMVKDKDIQAVLNILPEQAAYYITQAHIPRALPAEKLQEMAEDRGLKTQRFENVNEAIRTAVNLAGAEDLILICGSFFLVAEINETSALNIEH